MALTMVLLMGAGAASASDLNEVAALLVYPNVAALPVQAIGAEFETFITITNTGASDVIAHASYIDGISCFECNFSVPLTGADTETLVVTTDVARTGITIQSLDGTVDRSCDQPFGMMVVSLEDATTGETLTDNILFGEQVFVNYTQGFAFSIPAIPFQGIAGNGDRNYGFNDVEYKGFPRRLAADFLAPHDPNGAAIGLFLAELTLFTLDFQTQQQPFVDCRINGFDAAENNFSNSVLMDCWDVVDLCLADAEFCYPNLGVGAATPNNPANFDTHGWLALDCEVNGKDGGVHGAIVQVADPNVDIDKDQNPNEILGGWVAWGRLLYQSATAGDATTLRANPGAPGPGGWD
ncbi:MAG: hypothetical protein GY716_10865 [bacterium]|nr:hypothetical protein [bacterium]